MSDDDLYQPRVGAVTREPWVFVGPMGQVDDWRCFMAAAAVAEASGVPLKVLPGTYVCNRAVRTPDDGFVLECGPSVSIRSELGPRGVHPGNYPFYFDAPGATGSGTLDEAPALGATELSYASGVAPVVGQYLQLLHGVSSVLYRVVEVEGEASPWTVTIDRATNLPWEADDDVQVYASQPSGCDLRFHGATLSGTGDQMIMVARSDRIRVSDVRYSNDNGGPIGVPIGYDLGCSRCVLEDFAFDEGNYFYAQSSEDLIVRRGTVSNELGYGILLLDCVNSTVEGVDSKGCSYGVGISSFVGEEVTSLGSYYCSIVGGVSNGDEFGAMVAHAGPSYACTIRDRAAINCGTGFYVGELAVATRLDNLTVRDCEVGWLIQDGAADTKVTNIRADGCTDTTFGCSSDVDVNGFVLHASSAQGVMQFGGEATDLAWRLRAGELSQGDTGGYGIYVGPGTLEIDGVLIFSTAVENGGTNEVGIYAPVAGTVISARNLRIVDCRQGIYVASGSTLILGGNVDLSECTAPFTLVAGSSVFGRFDAATSAITMTTADKTATWSEYAADVLFISGTLGAGRDLKIPCYRIPQTWVNGSDQTVTVKAIDYAGNVIGSGLAIAAGATKRGVFDGSNYVQVG